MTTIVDQMAKAIQNTATGNWMGDEEGRAYARAALAASDVRPCARTARALTGVFVLKTLQDRRDGTQPIWRAIVDGVVVPAEFNSRGAAEAAVNVERARRKC